MNKKYLIPFAALSVLGMTNVEAARGNQDNCAPEAPATCYADDCKHCYCLGPENYGVNAPVCPKTCNGDLMITVEGFYWNSHQDGMEYAIDNRVTNPINANNPPTTADIQTLNNLIDAEYETPNFKWDWGFKAGIGYCTTCDGWDIGVLWTWYRGKANDHIEAEADDNHTLLPLWSAFAPAQGSVLYATDIETNWKLQLNLIDIELGRNFWTSKYLAIRPFVGIRIAYIDQSFEIQHKGGSWSERTSTAAQPAFNNEVDIDNDFKGVGLRAGLNSTWNLGCGWAIYGDLAASIVYGRFSIDHEEENRLATSPHDKTKVTEFDYSFRASRAILDLGLGLQWSTMFCDCQYGLTVALGWEHHLFFDQNQMWRVVRIGDTDAGFTNGSNNTGENVYHQRRGDLDTQGWTLKVAFGF
ncbi:MAG: Lpg1974 family pore-forming outer membrane protein [Simkaniaceae bacterium]|nr:Lpg1974 family pore-forming outer membrane protein [Candidatus Sacchlamyda saccharinae]